MGLDSEASCVPSGIVQTTTRHNEYHGFMLAQQITGTNYVAAIVSDSSSNYNRYESLSLNVYQASPGLSHVSTMPLADINEWWSAYLNLFEIGSNIYVSYFGPKGLQIARLSTLDLP